MIVTDLVVARVDQLLKGLLEDVVVDVLLVQVVVVELLLEHGPLIELDQGQLFGWLQVGLTLGEVGLDGCSWCLSASLMARNPPSSESAGPRSEVRGPRSGQVAIASRISIGPPRRLCKAFSVVPGAPIGSDPVGAPARRGPQRSSRAA